MRVKSNSLLKQFPLAFKGKAFTTSTLENFNERWHDNLIFYSLMQSQNLIKHHISVTGLLTHNPHHRKLFFQEASFMTSVIHYEIHTVSSFIKQIELSRLN